MRKCGIISTPDPNSPLQLTHNFLYNTRPHFDSSLSNKRGDALFMLEVAPIVSRIKDLSERTESLRRYL